MKTSIRIGSSKVGLGAKWRLFVMLRSRITLQFISTIVLSTFLIQSPSVAAKTLGMVVGHINFFNSFSTGSVTVFDADSNTILGTLIIPTAQYGFGDVVITSDQSLGFVSDMDKPLIYVIDLTTSPPSLAGGANPITISHNGLDMAITADDKFLVVAGGASAPYPLSVIDLATRAEINTFSTGESTNSVDVCEDGSVLTTSPNLGVVSLFTMSSAGSVSVGNVGQQPIGYPINVYCAPGSKSGIVVDGTGSVQSFVLPGLTPVSTSPLSTFSGQSGTINPAGNRVFIRSDPFQAGGTIDAFAFDSATGVIGVTPLLTIPIQGQWQVNGVDQLAVHPDGSKLFVAQPASVNVYDAGNGTLLASITDPNIIDPAGVAIAHPKLVPFYAFTAMVKINARTAVLKVEGSFRLGQNTNGINPIMEAVSFQMGSVSKTIQPGSFSVDRKTGDFNFKGVISGNRVVASIQPKRIKGQFDYQIKMAGIDSNTISSQVNVSLTIGNDGGNRIFVK